METDLFLNKEKQLERWMELKRVFASHEVIEKGLQLFYIRADRTKRELLKKGLIRKLSNQEKITRKYDCRDAVYEWVG